VAILVDALSRNEQPGTIFVLEPDRKEISASFREEIQPHGLPPVQALQLASSMGGLPRRIVVVGCEPAELGGEEGVMGLSPPVQAAVEQAVETIENFVTNAAALAAG
jgi:hydrogenase maturation protease